MFGDGLALSVAQLPILELMRSSSISPSVMSQATAAVKTTPDAELPTIFNMVTVPDVNNGTYLYTHVLTL